MVEKNNASCSICGTEYYVCKSCSDSMKLHPWKMHCCSPSCYQSYQVVRGISTGVYSKDEAKEKFKNVDLSNLENYRPHIKKIIKDVLKEDKPVVEPIVEVTKVAEVIEEAPVVEKVEPVTGIDEKATYRKRSYKFGSAE